MVEILKKPQTFSSARARIGAAIGPHDPYWVQVREMVYRRVEQLGVDLIPLEISTTNEGLYRLDPASLAEELLSQELDVVVCQTLPLGTITQLVFNNLPVIYLGESEMQHPLFCSPHGLYEAGRMGARYIAQKIGGSGRVLCVGGLLDLGEDKGVSRISGFMDALRRYPDISVLHCPTAWRYDQAYPLALSALRELGAPIDALFGISDSLALAGRDAGRELGVFNPRTVIVGVNGDPLALAAILDGSFSATVETSAEALGEAAVNLAYQAALGKALPVHFPYAMHMITAENVVEHAVRKMVSISNLPTLLVGVNREEERHRLMQMETGATINRNVGALLNRRQIIDEVTTLIRTNYEFDRVRFFQWVACDQTLVRDGQEGETGREVIPLEEAVLMGEAVRKNETIFIPDTRYSHRFSQDLHFADTRSRVVLPIRLGGSILGLLDLQSQRPVLNLRWDLVGLRSLADQFAIALRNAELYSEALQSRESAERANQLKTRLLANVSHELRAPLNVILGYSQAALATPNLYGIPLPENLQRDLRYIYQSGEHLIRIINDLLDLSRAEIGELTVFPEVVDSRAFLKEVFESIAFASAGETPGVEWRLELPERLPVIRADPVRLRQVLLNLLSNARKFTRSGHIGLGAAVEPPYLHFWVVDSGSGISIDQQERIFEPFVSSGSVSRRGVGIGLGLSITRRLVALHQGSMSLESQPGQGSTFHVYWPLPNLTGELALPAELGERPALLYFSSVGVEGQPFPPEIEAMAARQKMEVCLLHDGEQAEALLREVQPAALVWDMETATLEDWNLIHGLRRHPRLASLPLVLLGEKDWSSPVRESGLTNVILKPFHGEHLVDFLENLHPRGATQPVLIVDDDPQARGVYERLVQEAIRGVSVSLAEDGEQAQRLLAEQTPSLVILDLMLPGIDGFQVLESIRQDPRTARVPVVVLSGKLLTFEDTARLNYSRVVFHSKGLMDADEIMQAIQASLSGESHLRQPTSVLVKQALAFVHQHYTEPLQRAAVAEAVGVSENYLTQIFRQELGMPPLECINRLRIYKARGLLLAGDATVTAIASAVGFDDPAYFSRVFRKIVGCPPQAYRKQGK